MTRLALGLLVAMCAAPAWGAPAVSGPKNLQLTVYNGNFALVKDNRTVTLAKGTTAVDVEDVAARIDPTSVLFKSLTAPNAIGVLEQNYRYDLISPENILSKSVGQRVTFMQFNDQGQPILQSGILLNPPNNGGVVIRTDAGAIVMNPSGTVSVEKMPDGLYPKPTLNWLLQSDVEGAQEAEISYITEGIGWKADYVALVNEADTALDLSGWVTLNNQSGATYDDAKLTLMAGDVRRVQDGDFRESIMLGVPMAAASPAPQFEEKSFFEYHMYTMERATTIRNNETKQLSLLNASGAPVVKEMIYDGRQEWWRNWWYPGQGGDPGGGYDTSDNHKVNVVLVLKNSKDNHMGMPLPKGKVRVYKLDDDGKQQFIGEDQIDHTPKDEKIRLYVGDAFDVVGDYKRTNYRKISPREMEESFEVKLRNHKETPVEVKVVDHVWSDWKVIESSHKFTKKDAQTIEFPVKVAKDGETVVTYTIRTKW